MAQLTINTFTAPIKNWKCEDNKYIIDIQKDFSFSELELILNQSFYIVEIHFEEKDEKPFGGCDCLSFSTEYYLFLSCIEENDYFELIYQNKQSLQPTTEEKLQAKLDYLSIMTGMDLQEI